MKRIKSLVSRGGGRRHSSPAKQRTTAPQDTIEERRHSTTARPQSKFVVSPFKEKKNRAAVSPLHSRLYHHITSPTEESPRGDSPLKERSLRFDERNLTAEKDELIMQIKEQEKENERKTRELAAKLEEQQLENQRTSEELRFLQDQVRNAQSSHNDELLSKLEEKQQDVDRKSEELLELQQKFRALQNGMAGVERERHYLAESKAKLEREKSEIMSQLTLREHEVFTLARRCTSQNEGMREAGELRNWRNSLVSEMEDLKLQLSGETSTVETLKRQLDECNEDRRELRARLVSLKRDHDNVADTLNNCFENMQKMEARRNSHDVDRQRDEQRAGLVLERQRLEHFKEMNKLKEELQMRQERVDQMEDILKSKMASATAIRKEKADLTKQQEEELESMRKNHEAAVDEIQAEHEVSINCCLEEHAKRIESLRNDLEAKDEVIAGLEDEVASYMNKLMSLSSEIDKLNEENAHSARVHESTLRAMEREKSQLKEALEGKEIENSVLSVKLSNLEEEQTDMLVELKRMEDRVQELEDENAFILDLEHQLNEVNEAVFEVEDEKERSQRYHDEKIERMKESFEDERQMWETMEQGLVARVRMLEEEKSMEQLRLVGELENAQRMINSLEAKVAKSNENLASLNSNVEIVESTVTSQNAKLNVLATELSQEKRANAEKNDRIAELEEELRSAEIGIEKRKEESSEAEDQSSRALSSVEADLSAEVERSAKLNMEVATLINDLSACESRLFVLKEENAQNCDRVTMLEKEVEEKQLKATRSETELQELKAELQLSQQQAAKEITSLSKIVEQRDETIENLKKRENDISSEATGTQSDLKCKIQTIDQMVSEKHALETALEAKDRALQKAQEQLERAFAEVETSDQLKTAAEGQINEMDAEVTTAKEIAKAREDELSKSLSEATELKFKLALAEDEVLNLTQKVMMLETECVSTTKRAEESLKIQSTQIPQLSQQLNDTQVLLAEATKRMQYLEGRLNSQGEQADVALSVSNSKMLTLEREITILEDKHNAQEKALQSKAAKIEKLEIQLNEATTKGGEKSREIVSLNLEIKRLQSTIEFDASRNEAKVTTLTGSLSSLEDQLEVVQAELQAKTVEVERLTGEVESTNQILDIERSTLRRQFEKQEMLISSLRSDLQEERVASKKKGANNSSLNAEVERIRSKSEQDQRARSKALAAKDESIASLKAELIVTQESIERQTVSLREELDRKTAQADALKKSLKDAESDMALADERNNKLLEEKNSEIEKLKKELSNIGHTNASHRLVKAELQAKSKDIVDLEGQVESLKLQIDDEQKSSRSQVISLTSKLEKSTLDVALLQDEIRDLKMIDLKDASEMIESLEADLAKARKATATDEKATTTKISSLQAEVTFLQREIYKFEKEMEDKKYLHSRTSSKLDSDNAALKDENSTLHADIKEMSQKLEERHTTIVNQTAKIEVFQRRQAFLDLEVKRLSSANERAEEEKGAALFALEREIEKNKVLRADGDIEFQKRAVDIQKRLAEKEAELKEAQELNTELEQQLDGRSKLLAEMVKHNKSTEESNIKSQKELDELKAATEAYKSGKENVDSEITNLKKAFLVKEDKYLEIIQEEQQKREIAETDLETTLTRIRESKRETKELSELQKENEDLRCKVKRQEAFLKRKLQKDKVLRERATKNTLTTPARNSRLSSPRKRTSLASSRISRITTPSIISNNSSFTGEIDWDDDISLWSK